MSLVSYEVQIKVRSTGHRNAYFNGMKIPCAPPPQHFKDGDTAILSCTYDGVHHPGPWQWRRTDPS